MRTCKEILVSKVLIVPKKIKLYVIFNPEDFNKILSINLNNFEIIIIMNKIFKIA